LSSVEGGESAVAAEIADHLLRFSRAFYDSFRVRTNRLRFWRMLFLILEKERAGDGEIRDDFSIQEIRSILALDRPEEHRDRWRRQLIKQFRNHSGPFLEEVREETAPAESPPIHKKRGRPVQAKTKIFKLSPHFEAGGRMYVRSTVATVLGMAVPESDLEGNLEKRGPVIFRKMMGIIGGHYFPAYSRVMDELVAIADNNAKLASAIKEYPSYWTIMLLAWQQRNRNPEKSLTRREFKLDVGHALRNVDKTEVLESLSSLIESEILVPDPTSNEGGYVLNIECMPALGRYAAILQAARTELISLLAAEISSTH
jgi:hypothetical protein